MNKLLDKLFPHRVKMRVLAYSVRASFERGYRCNRPNCARDEWMEQWLKSPERQALKGMGLINDGDGFR